MKKGVRRPFRSGGRADARTIFRTVIRRRANPQIVDEAAGLLPTEDTVSNAPQNRGIPLRHAIRQLGRPSELCAKLIAAEDTEDLGPVLLELKATLHEHSLRTKELIAERTRMLQLPDSGNR